MAQGQLHIGWQRGEITPPGRTFVMGQFHARISDEVRSPLTATALALEVRGADGASEQAVLLSCDLTLDDVKADLRRELTGRCPGLDLDKLTVNATHTHTAPCLTAGFYEAPQDDPDFLDPDTCRRWVAGRLADIVADAWAARQPGGLARGFGYAVVGRCRRAVYADGSAQMYGAVDREDFRGFEACDDHAVNLLFTRDADGELTGILVNLACPAQCEEAGSYFSADFWHEVREAVAARYGPDVHLLPQCAPAGELSPHLMTDHTEEADLRGRLDTDDKGIIARRIMAAVDEALATASPTQASLELTHQVHTWKLPRLRVTDQEYELEKRLPAMSEKERAQQPFGFRRRWPFGPICDLVTRYQEQDEHPMHEVESHVIRLGDVALATNPFELFVDYGHRIRGRSRAVQTFLVQLADGSNMGFYLPTERARAGGHYSAVTKSSWVGPEGGTLLVEKTVDAINTLFAGDDYPRTR